MADTKIDTTYQTMQRDLFASGLAAQIGMSAFGVWQAIKAHADFNTGEAWPGMRRLADWCGMSLTTVSTCVDTLQKASLVRVVAKGQGKRGATYVARERMTVRMGDRVICTIVVDYVPATLRSTIEKAAKAINSGKTSPDAFTDCEVIPGDGFVWDASAGVLRASIPSAEIRGPGDDYPQADEPPDNILLT